MVRYKNSEIIKKYKIFRWYFRGEIDEERTAHTFTTDALRTNIAVLNWHRHKDVCERSRHMKNRQILLF